MELNLDFQPVLQVAWDFIKGVLPLILPDEHNYAIWILGALFIVFGLARKRFLK